MLNIKNNKINLNLLYLIALFKHTLESHVQATLLNTAVIIVIRTWLSIGH